MQIIHQKQICDKSCMSACIAMILNKPIQYVAGRFHDEFIASPDAGATARGFLMSENVEFRRGYSDETAQLGGLYLLVVPSLHKVGGAHEVVMDARDSDAWVQIYDPQKGREGKYYYVWDEKELAPLECNVLHYNIDYQIIV